MPARWAESEIVPVGCVRGSYHDASSGHDNSCNPIMASLAQRLEDRDKCPMEIVVVVMRKLLHLLYGILKSGLPFDPHYLDNRAAIA